MDRGGEWLIAADDTVTMVIGDGDVAGVVDGEWQSEWAFAAFLFGLESVDLPVGGVLQLHLVANMMFAGELVDAALGGGVGDVEAGLGKAAWRPDVGEGSATAIADPKPLVLPFPFPVVLSVFLLLCVLYDCNSV